MFDTYLLFFCHSQFGMQFKNDMTMWLESLVIINLHQDEEKKK